MVKTLATGLQAASVDFATLHKQYHPVLAVVKEMIGVVPNCDPILEIWPPAFRSYNVLVPNLFNLPNVLFTSRSFKSSIGLAMYSASRAAACAYCMSHTCSFALRRGVSADAITGKRTPKEQAVVDLATGLATIPASLNMEQVRMAGTFFTDTEVEWLALAASMMGFLNKFMNAMGIQLEQDAIDDTASVLSVTGWTPGQHAQGDYRITKTSTPPQDNLFTYLRVVKQAPGAIALEKKWTRDVPYSYALVSDYLQNRVGYSFPILKPITQRRVVRAIATVIADNLNKELTVVGLKTKMLAGYIFSRIVANDALTNEMKNISYQLAPDLATETYDRLDAIARWEIPQDSLSCKEAIASVQIQLNVSEKEAVALMLALAASPSPALLSESVVETILSQMEPAAIVETVAWLSVLQLLHRLNSYYSVIFGLPKASLRN